MNYLTNPYLWVFCTSFGIAKFLSLVFSKIAHTVLQRMYEKQKVKKIFFWFSVSLLSLLVCFFLYQTETFSLPLAGLFFLIVFVSFFLFAMHPKIFILPLIVAVFVFSLVASDLSKNWLYVDNDIYDGIPLLSGTPVTGSTYQLYAGPQSQRKVFSTTLQIPPGTDQLHIKLLEIHPSPIWFLWWPNNYFYIREISTARGEVLWKNESVSPVLQYLVGKAYGWIVNSESVSVNPRESATIFWRAYEWIIEGPRNSTAVTTEESIPTEPPISQDSESSDTTNLTQDSLSEGVQSLKGDNIFSENENQPGNASP